MHRTPRAAQNQTPPAAHDQTRAAQTGVELMLELQRPAREKLDKVAEMLVRGAERMQPQ